MNDIEEVRRLITEARDEARAERKKCWHEDIEEKAELDGQVSAYNYCLQMIKNEFQIK